MSTSRVYSYDPTCDWCDERATWYDRGGEGVACAAHRRDLQRHAEARIARSGNPFAGEASESAVRPIGIGGVSKSKKQRHRR